MDCGCTLFQAAFSWNQSEATPMKSAFLPNVISLILIAAVGRSNSQAQSASDFSCR